MGGCLGAVVVNYCSFELTIRCVESIIKFKVVDPSNIVIVDNFSPDGSGEKIKLKYPWLHVFLSLKNSGFSSGVNIGVSFLDTDFVLVLNPDTYFVDQSINNVVNLFKIHEDIGLIGLDLIYPDGRRQFSARSFYSWLDIFVRRSPLKSLSVFKKIESSHLMCSYWDEGCFEADWVMGTGFVVRRDLLLALGGMDERYFLYMEDVDLCARIWMHGKKVLAFPGAKLIHDHQQSSKVSPFSRMGFYHFKSLLFFNKKFRIQLFKRLNLRHNF